MLQSPRVNWNTNPGEIVIGVLEGYKTCTNIGPVRIPFHCYPDRQMA